MALDQRRDFVQAWLESAVPLRAPGQSGTSVTSFARATAQGTAIYEVGDSTGVTDGIFGELNDVSE